MTTFLSQPSFTVHHLFIIDTTQPNASHLTSQVNDCLDSIRLSAKKHLSQTHRITLMALESDQVRCLYHDLDMSCAQDYIISDKKAHGPSQLLDAIGTCIATWRALSKRDLKSSKYQVTVFSSGRDRGSRKYSTCTIKTIISSLVSTGWKFTIIGSTPLLPQVAEKLGINNYYISKSESSARDRNFLISQLRRQWRRQQLACPADHHQAAA